MNRILSSQHRNVLEQFAWSKTLLAFDFDGTLAPIVADPDNAAMRVTTRRLLAHAAALYPCVVISGRGLADTAKRLSGVPLRAVIGNHGLEPIRATRRALGEARRWVPLLERRLAGERGVTIEDKTYSIAVHYRHSRAKKRAREAILAAAQELGKTRIVGGKQVINILPIGAPHKGLALERARDRLRCDTAIYIGDDDTDEDVFALDQPGRLLTIRVGSTRNSLAAYSIRNQRETDAFLRVLIQLRESDPQRASA